MRRTGFRILVLFLVSFCAFGQADKSRALLAGSDTTTRPPAGYYALAVKNGALYYKGVTGKAFRVMDYTNAGPVLSLSGTANQINVSASTGAIVASLPATVVLSSSLRVPLVVGGSAVNSNLVLRSTTASGTTDYISFQTGNSVERMRIFNNGGISFNGLSGYIKGNGSSAATASSTIPSGDVAMVTGRIGIGVGGVLSNDANLIYNAGGSGRLSVNGIDLWRNGAVNTTNIGLGGGALSSVSGGISNVMLGDTAGRLIVGGSYNVGLGHYALMSNVSGSRNVALGEAALRVNTADDNVAVGYQALLNNTKTQNVAVGNYALSAAISTASGNNTAIGYNAGANNVGANNVFVGYNAGSSVSGTRNFNVFIGGNTGSGYNTSSNVVLSDGNGGLKADWNSSGTFRLLGSGYNSAGVLTTSGSGDGSVVRVSAIPLSMVSGTNTHIPVVSGGVLTGSSALTYGSSILGVTGKGIFSDTIRTSAGINAQQYTLYSRRSASESDSYEWKLDDNGAGVGKSLRLDYTRIGSSGFTATNVIYVRNGKVLIAGNPYNVFPDPGSPAEPTASLQTNDSFRAKGQVTLDNYTGYFKGNGTSAATASSTIPLGDIAGTADRIPYVGVGGVHTSSGNFTYNGSVLYTAGVMRADGGIGLGTSTLTGSVGYNIRNSKSLTGGAIGIGVSTDGQIQSDVTTGYYYSSSVNVAAAASLTSFTHYNAQQGTVSGSIGVHTGFHVMASVAASSSNVFGFRGSVVAAAGRFNLYMDGTAANYLNGSLGIGTISPTSKLQVVGLPTYADNSAATTGGLTAGAFYRTSTGVVMVVY